MTVNVFFKLLPKQDKMIGIFYFFWPECYLCFQEIPALKKQRYENNIVNNIIDNRNNNSNNNNNNNNSMVLQYQAGVRQGITNRLMTTGL